MNGLGNGTSAREGRLEVKEEGMRNSPSGGARVKSKHGQSSCGTEETSGRKR